MNSGPFAIITPYFKEPAEVLKRCIDSVKHQSVSADHFLISDGYPQDWLDGAGVRHLRLGAAHKDLGNTPRGLGALLAISEGYKGIGFLDADNWYDPDHVEQCCAAANSVKGEPADLIVAKRRILLPDGTATKLPEEPNHIDSNCYWLLEGAFHLVHHWITMMPEVALMSDRLIYRVVKENSLTMYYTRSETVNYVGNYAVYYRAIGKTPPPDAKANITPVPIFNWIKSLDGRQRRLASQRCGVDLEALERDVAHSMFSRASRNESCPCGSGRKYKHCHGAYR
jgi:glycosyltransferase involved in cell wall biosynthesis